MKEITRWNRLKNFVFQEKSPLVLLVLSQAYVLYLWMVDWNVQSYPVITTIVAIITAVSLDSVVVSTTFASNRNAWSWITSIAAMASGVLIALDLFYKMQWLWLHASFPVLVFAYANHIATAKKMASESREIAGNKEEIITRILDVFGEDTAEYKIAKFVGGKTTKTLEMIKEIKENRKDIEGNND